MRRQEEAEAKLGGVAKRRECSLEPKKSKPGQRSAACSVVRSVRVGRFEWSSAAAFFGSLASACAFSVKVTLRPSVFNRRHSDFCVQTCREHALGFDRFSRKRGKRHSFDPVKASGHGRSLL